VKAAILVQRWVTPGAVRLIIATSTGARPQEASMVPIWIGALLFLSGILFMAAQPELRGRLSGGRLHSAEPSDTLEPRNPSRGFGMKANWPGFVLVALGTVLMLGAAVF